MDFDPKEFSNWLVNRGVTEDKLMCPLCGSGKLRFAMSPTLAPHIDEDGEPKCDPQTGARIGLVSVAIACGNCGFLRQFVRNVDALPEARFDSSL